MTLHVYGLKFDVQKNNRKDNLCMSMKTVPEKRLLKI